MVSEGAFQTLRGGFRWAFIPFGIFFFKKKRRYLAVKIIITTFASLLKGKGRLAQLVQSVCLTSRGSAVRIRQRPHETPKFLSKSLLFGKRALSSAGSERLPYKQRVGGSNPSAPTLLPDNENPERGA